MKLCMTPGCDRACRDEWAYCPTCANKLVSNALRYPVVKPPREPEWIRRMKARGLPAKEMVA